MCSEHTTNAVK